MPELWLVCEGEKGSVDVAILKPVLATILAAEIVVEPAGGERQLSTVARFLEDQRGGRAAYVKDRDYLPREAAEVALQERSPRFLLRRHSIENYLLPPQIIIRVYTIKKAVRRTSQRQSTTVAFRPAFRCRTGCRCIAGVCKKESRGAGMLSRHTSPLGRTTAYCAADSETASDQTHSRRSQSTYPMA